MNLGDLPRTVEANPKDRQDLERAVRLLETPSLTAQITNFIGMPVEALVKKLPDKAKKKIATAVEAALHKSVDVATWGMSEEPVAASTKLHKVAAAATGAAGGFFGIWGTLVELPFTTTLMMRAVADIARSEGFDVSQFYVRADCIRVFGLQGTKANDAETGYYAARATMPAFAQAVGKQLDVIAKEAARIAAEEAAQAGARGLSDGARTAANWLAELIAAIANRFNIQITEKFAAQAVPVVGAAAGAALNTMFMDFYQDMARGHFIVKRLEGVYGEAEVKSAYEKIAKGIKVG